MSTFSAAAPNTAPSPTPSTDTAHDRAAALAAYVALTQHLGDLSQEDLDAADLGATPAVTVDVRIVS